MNKERVLALADLIEKQPYNDNYDAPHGFGMGQYVHECGTPSCIAGFACATWGNATNESAFETGMKHLGLAWATADELFTPADGDDEPSPAWDATPAQAAACLRHLAESGEVDWDRAMGGAA